MRAAPVQTETASARVVHGSRRCRVCEKVKPLEAFPVTRTWKRHRCKSCNRAVQIAYRKSPEGIAARRAWVRTPEENAKSNARLRRRRARDKAAGVTLSPLARAKKHRRDVRYELRRESRPERCAALVHALWAWDQQIAYLERRAGRVDDAAQSA